MVAGVLGFVLALIVPHLRWLSYPSLFDDDFLRVASLQHSTLGQALFRPFNEHMAPLFEVVSWLAWMGSGRSVMAIPLGFQVASYLALATMLVLAFLWVRQEVLSSAAGLMAVALLVLSAVSAETVLWYSASSFEWAAAATIAAALTAALANGAADRTRRVRWTLASALASLIAPAFSAVGVLAGPVAATRIAAGGQGRGLTSKRLAWSMAPLVGTATYLVVCERFHYRELVSASVRRSIEPTAAAWATLRAPGGVLLPGLVGLGDLTARMPGWVLAIFTLLGLVASLAWAARSRFRGFVLVCLVFLLGGYGSTYATRARPGDLWIFQIQRYHLFPQIGLVGLMVAVASGPIRRLDGGPARGWVGVALATGLLAVVQAPEMRRASDRAYRYSDQPRALLASEHLAEICRREGITLPQVMFALEPIRPPWFPNPSSVNPLIYLLPPGPVVAKVANERVRETLIAALSPEDRECLFGGMEATRHARPACCWQAVAPAVEAKPIQARSPGARSQDFEVDPIADDARALSLTGFGASSTLEVRWTGAGDDWSLYRSLRWDATKGEGSSESAVPFALMPHWRRGEVRRVRVIGHEPGPLPAGQVRFLK
jgi:hypothetical protein